MPHAVDAWNVTTTADAAPVDVPRTWPRRVSARGPGDPVARGRYSHPVTEELYAEKTAPGVFQFVRASHGVDTLFADLAQGDVIHPSRAEKLVLVQSKFGVRAAEVRRRFDLAHETGHAALVGHVAAAVTLSNGGRKTFVVAELLAARCPVVIVDEIDGVVCRTPGVVRAPDWYGVQPATPYARLRSAHPDFFSPARSQRLDGVQRGTPAGVQPARAPSGPLTRYGVRVFARAVRAGSMVANARSWASSVLSRCWAAAGSLGQCPTPPDPAQPPGRRVASRRRPARGPNTSWICRPIHGVASA